MKKVILSLVLIAGLATAGVLIYGTLHPRTADRILLSGNIELPQVDIAFKTAGRLIERNVDEGDAVRKGMIVARLDRDQLLRQRQREQASLTAAQALVSGSEAALNWRREALAAEMDLRQADMAVADARLRELKNGARPEEIQEAKAAVEASQAEYARSKKDWERGQALYKNDDISAAQYDQFRTRFESAQANLKQVTERAALVAAGPRAEVIENASAQAGRARAGLKMGEANHLELAQREEEIAARRADSARTRAQIGLIDSQLADTIAVSPIDGVVLIKAADVGEVLAPGTAVVTVGDLDHPWLRAYITERDLGRVKLGSKVKVTTDSFPNRVFNGRVSFIASEAEFTPKQIQTREERVKLVYRIKIDIDNPGHELKSNMPADAEILLGS